MAHVVLIAWRDHRLLTDGMGLKKESIYRRECASYGSRVGASKSE